MLKSLDPLLHSELRLGVMSILLGVEEADFVFLRQETGATAGNLSVQLDKLQKAGYITVEKTFRANFYKCGDKTVVQHYSTWNPILLEKPDYHQSSFFGKITLSDEAL